MNTPTIPTAAPSPATRPVESHALTLTLALAGLPWDRHHDAVRLALLGLEELTEPSWPTFYPNPQEDP